MRTAINFLFPKFIWNELTRIFGICLFFKFIFFNLIWCLQTTFTPFSRAETYLSAGFMALVFLIPYACFRLGKVQMALLFILDGLLIVNLMYLRTYYTAIPLASYGLVGNLSDFKASVYDSLRWSDLLFPLSSLFCVYYYRKQMSRKPEGIKGFYKRAICKYMLLLALFFIPSVALATFKGGFKEAYASLRYNANMHTCDTPMYTIFGSLLYDSLQSQEIYTPKMDQEIKSWLSVHPSYKPLPDSVGRRTNLVVILAESFESWALGKKVEGKEITPYLNKLIKEPATLYAPRVLTQVKDGRSIDAQLILNAGMLPVSRGTYSTLYPDNTFYTLTKAMKKINHAKAYLLTVDKKIVWNQNIVARRFGIDTLLSKPCFRLDEKVGPRRKLGDASFFRQCAEKIANNEIWKKGENVYLQCVTYSGHNPFKLQKELQQISFAGDYPQKMKDYMILANYTDRAIGKFIEFLRSRPEYAQTLIVITGDHEGLASDRAPICATKAGKEIVSDKPFTPFIVINSPVGLKYNEVMGQIDMYPTILNLMRLDDYCWKGIGQSILDPDKIPFSVGSQMNVEGDMDKVPAQELERAKRAYAVSDLMIRFDYWRRAPLN
ncbi:MAG: LTA synthase family protein [Bacteroides sp.]|jgi:phosphoglycerol transferase MdoB-like AlkP superfamily enzyme|nr:LTA synthase family protein [Bacteroides sp.]MCI1682674.1 LTA synthase family protein [Bacteroides sp.]